MADDTFTTEERAAMKQRSKELRTRKGRTTPEEDRAEALAAIAALGDDERRLAERVFGVVSEAAPDLAPRTWYSSPAWAKDGKVVVFYQQASKFKVRYATLGFSETARLDDGAMWPTSFAVADVTPEVEARIVDLVRRAVGS
ncbi:hypothetical protein [uncultured Amnibacterium sp.]|uniref:hypothetical protein n=1 Tax=uncultured Amnibacterium sp. TaxID=1631851 RepID=UPI0035CBC20A